MLAYKFSLETLERLYVNQVPIKMSNFENFINDYPFDSEEKLISRLSKYEIVRIDWGDIEKTIDKFDKESIETYFEKINAAAKNGSKVIATLADSGYPEWFDNMGGWENPESPPLFDKFVDYVSANLIGLVSNWITFLEPNLKLINKYYDFEKGTFAAKGKEKGKEKYLKSAANVVRAHIGSYGKIHEAALNKNIEDANVGIVLNFGGFYSIKENIITKYFRNSIKSIFLDNFISGMIGGTDFIASKKDSRSELGRYLDFLGFTYREPYYVDFRASPSDGFNVIRQKKDVIDYIKPKHSNNSDIDNILIELYRKYDIPIMAITKDKTGV
ncbi:MAG TPA: family 1 glycosylhydrolase [Spirochaetota bacterium]|nr:family 1 glycosylhydrolase [Spirochaetota bacterium]HOS31866.1 family 1 glycosylhydrolase [Spirochaetota bacterium]HOS54453.1 family 1 glycosylhydrolase [Spirochaetota bacterium]HPK62263.1 family 1 glycosylhydrolase [Spirochaetota bacterium]HQF76946.1 family 1 glycosylhydrolase [Spirochaetota bacterium]